jgi:hypothetical protein
MHVLLQASPRFYECLLLLSRLCVCQEELAYQFARYLQPSERTEIQILTCEELRLISGTYELGVSTAPLVEGYAQHGNASGRDAVVPTDAEFSMVCVAGSSSSKW